MRATWSANRRSWWFNNEPKHLRSWKKALTQHVQNHGPIDEKNWDKRERAREKYCSLQPDQKFRNFIDTTTITISAVALQSDRPAGLKNWRGSNHTSPMPIYFFVSWSTSVICSLVDFNKRCGNALKQISQRRIALSQEGGLSREGKRNFSGRLPLKLNFQVKGTTQI
jgi:hypothetical protein